MKYLKLTHGIDDVMINLDEVSRFETRSTIWGSVVLKDGTTYEIDESPRQIKKMIEDGDFIEV